MGNNNACRIGLSGALNGMLPMKPWSPGTDSGTSDAFCKCEPELLFFNTQCSIIEGKASFPFIKPEKQFPSEKMWVSGFDCTWSEKKFYLRSLCVNLMCKLSWESPISNAHTVFQFLACNFDKVAFGHLPFGGPLWLRRFQPATDPIGSKFWKELFSGGVGLCPPSTPLAFPHTPQALPAPWAGESLGHHLF